MVRVVAQVLIDLAVLANQSVHRRSDGRGLPARGPVLGFAGPTRLARTRNAMQLERESAKESDLATKTLRSDAPDRPERALEKSPTGRDESEKTHARGEAVLNGGHGRPLREYRVLLVGHRGCLLDAAARQGGP